MKQQEMESREQGQSLEEMAFDHLKWCDKIYGRATEVQCLLDCYERVTQSGTELVLLVGPSGVGKTAIVQEFRQRLEKLACSPMFVRCKFEQFHTNEPLKGIVQGLEQSLKKLDPELDFSIVAEDLKPDLTSHSIHPNRPHFHLPHLSQQLIQWLQSLSRDQQPLVLFLDDLHWADPESLRLMQQMTLQSYPLLIIGAYQEQEVSPNHALRLTLEQLQRLFVPCHALNLGPLTLACCVGWLRELLNDTSPSIQALAELIEQLTKGNPFFVQQFLLALYRQGELSYDIQTQTWHYDLEEIQRNLKATDLVEFLAHQLAGLPDENQFILQLSACLGNHFHLEDLSRVYAASRVMPKTLGELGMLLQPAVTQGFLRQISDQSYCFVHDRIQQATCLLMPKVETQNQSECSEPTWAIAQVLLSNLPLAGRESQIFEIIDQLDPAWHLVQSPHRQLQLTQLNLVAGRRARVNQDYAGAIRYFTRGLEWLPKDAWTTHYDLTLDLHEAAAEAEYRHTNFFRAASLAETILEQAQSLRDQARAKEIQIRLHLAAAQHDKALSLGLEFLQQLGLSLNLTQKREVLSVEALEQLPMMTRGDHLVLLRMLSLLVWPCLEARPQLLLPLSQMMLDLTEASGLSKYAAIAYSIQAMLHHRIAVAEQAIWILNQLNTREMRGQTLLLIYGRIYLWQTPLEEVETSLAETIQVALESGELEAAAEACLHYCTCRFLRGLPLETVATDYVCHQETLEMLQQALPCLLNQAFQRLIQALQDPARASWTLPGRPRLVEEIGQRKSLPSITFMEALAQGILYYLGREMHQAIAALALATQYQASMVGLLPQATRVFYSALTLLALCREVPIEQQWSLLERAEQYQTRLVQWKNRAPKNFQHQWELVVAERARTLHQPSRAIEYYERAIASAAAQNYRAELAIAYELAGEFYLETHQPQVARVYLRQAHQAYRDWGALAKANALQLTYAALLVQEEQANRLGLGSYSEVVNVGRLPASGSVPSADVSSELLKQVLRATRPLFPATGDWDELLSTLLRAVATLIPARRVVLFLPKGQQLSLPGDSPSLRGEGFSRESSNIWELEIWAHRPTLESAELTLHWLPYRTPDVLAQLQAKVEAVARSGLLQTEPRAGFSEQLYLPLGYPHALGVLYLDAFPGNVFTGYHQQLLELIGQHSAIALAHARTQVSLEQNVHRRTQELRDEISERRQTESQLAQQLRRVELLESITRKIRESLHPEEIFQSAAESLGTAFQASRCVIHQYVLAEEELRLPLVAEYLSTGCESICPHLPPIERNPYIQAILDREDVVAATNVYTHGMDNEARIFCLRTELKSLLAVKTFYKGQTNGIVVLHQCNRFREWSQNEIELVGALADQVGIALAQARLVETEQRQRQELEQAKARAEEASQSKGQFIASLGHELRTPLNAILGYGRLMGQDAKLTLKHQHMVQTITHSGEHLLKLVEDVVAMAKLEAGRATLAAETVDVERLLRSLRDVFFLQMKLKGLNFILEIDPLVPRYIRADGGKLRQILMNLLGNAVKFTVEGSVTVRVSPMREAMVLEEDGENWEFLYFEVEDTGPGIAPEDINRLFQDFEQTEVGRRADVGTGLGLSISRKLVELMGGKIGVESEPTVKTIFRFHVLVERLPEDAGISSEQSDKPREGRSPAPLPRLTSESLMHLPLKWIDRLHHATLLLDQEALFQVLDELPEEQGELRNAIAQLVHQFAYEAILDLTRTPLRK